MLPMNTPALETLSNTELRNLAQRLQELLQKKDAELLYRQSKIDKLTHELSLHKRARFGVKSERLPVEQAQLFEETTDADLAAIEEELAELTSPAPDKEKRQPKRAPLPPELPRTEIHHEPDSTPVPVVAA